MTIRALIVDDEPAARRGIVRRLREQGDIEIVGECGDGAAAIAAIAIAAALTVVRAAGELTVVSSNGYQAVLEELAPRFEAVFVVSNAAVRDQVARACEELDVPCYGPTFDS